MDERDLEIQALRRRLEAVTEENDILLGELYAIHDCITCAYCEESAQYCDEFMFGRMCRDKQYKWRGAKAADEWQQEEVMRKQAEKSMSLRLSAIGDEFERVMGEKK